ncbi:hypothetical protein ILYODFUR_034272 [Ilyodon furcidens]|uniref:Uncharacterized protein n=1 Tax=Ilyodon furcidens TaxID=33524 RepID=A0ABV0TRU6_9TELE
MSDNATKVVNETSQAGVFEAQSVPLSKCCISLTAKGMMFFIQTCQEKTSIKCKQAKRYMNQLSDLMQSMDNISFANSPLSKLITSFEEATQMHESFLSLDLPEGEIDRQTKYF